MTTVLIMEDNQDLCAIYARALPTDPYTLQFAATLHEAADWLDRETFDIFLCDMQLGEEHGIDLLRQRREVLIGGHTITVVVSAQENYRKLCEALGVEFFISKPIDMKALVALLDRLTQHV